MRNDKVVVNADKSQSREEVAKPADQKLSIYGNVSCEVDT